MVVKGFLVVHCMILIIKLRGSVVNILNSDAMGASLVYVQCSCTAQKMKFSIKDFFRKL